MDRMPAGEGPGAQDRFDPYDLEDVRERIVLPIVNSLITPDELRQVDVGWGPRLPRTVDQLLWAQRHLPDQSKDLWVLVRAAGKTLEWQLWLPTNPQNDPMATLGDIAFDYALRVEQWVEDELGRERGQVARYSIPARMAPA